MQNHWCFSIFEKLWECVDRSESARKSCRKSHLTESRQIELPNKLRDSSLFLFSGCFILGTPKLGPGVCVQAKGASMLTNLNSVPTSLRQIPRWVLWHKYLERKSGKWKKCPWRVDLQRESKRLEPDGWGTSEKALAAFQESGERMNGLGLWLDGSDDLVCIDLCQILI